MNTDDNTHVRFSVRLPVALIRSLEAEALAANRSLNSLITLKLIAATSPGMPVAAPAPAVEVRKRDPAARGTRWHPEDAVPASWIAEGVALRERRKLPPIDLVGEAEDFVRFWVSRAGPGSTKLNWKLTWLNRVASIKGAGNARQYGKPDHPLGIFGKLYGEAKQRR